MLAIPEILNNWADGLISDLIKSYEDNKIKASGNWAEELEFNSELKDNKISMSFLAPKYTGALTDGRDPNKDQSPEKLKAWVGWAGNNVIKDWVENKGLNLNPFAVAYSIATNGWKVPNKHNDGKFISNVITNERIGNLGRDLLFGKIGSFKSELIKELQHGDK